MKKTLYLLTLLTSTAFSQPCSAPCPTCQIEEGYVHPINLVLQPGEQKVLTWNFTNCWFSIKDLTLKIYENMGEDRILLSKETKLQTQLMDTITKQVAEKKAFVHSLPLLDRSLMELRLKNNESKPLTITIVYVGVLSFE